MGTAGLHAEIDPLLAAGPGCDPAVVGAELLEIDRAVHRLMAAKSEWLASFDAAEGFLDGESTSTKGWLRAQTLTSPGRAAAETAVARVRGRLPVLSAAWDAGATTFEHVRVVEVGLRKLPAVLWGEVDAPLTEHAKVLDTAEFAVFVRKLAEALDDEPKPVDETRHEARRLSVSVDFDGMTTLAGRVTPEVGEKLRAALSAASRPDAPGEVRLKNQRTADALEHVLDTVLGCGQLPVDGGEKPHLTIAVDLDQLDESAQHAEEQARCQPGWWTLSAEQQAARIADAAAAAGTAADGSSGRPAFYWTGPASVAAARRLACDGMVLPIFTRGGKPLDVGRATRVVSGPMRKFIVARDQTCRWPKCGKAARWSQIHHVRHWRDGGPTDAWNLILICEEHHRAAHDGRWTVVLQAPGQIAVERRKKPDDPYYDIRVKDPPVEKLTVHQKLDDTARRMAAT